MDTTTELERKRLQELAREYREKGYEVIVEPSKNALPNFLSDYEPDMIARNDEESVVVEVKSRSSLVHSEYLQPLADRIKEKAGWRFELVITNPKEESVSNQVSTLPSEVELVNRIQETRKLMTSGHKEAALLLGWATAEGALRLVAAREGVFVRKHSPAYIIKYMTSMGLLNKSDYNLLEGMLGMRNEVVHGFKLTKFTAKKFAQFLDVINRILATKGDT